MKKSILALIAALLLVSGIAMAGGEETTLPNKLVSQSFVKDFPAAQKASWQKDKNNIYVALFVNNDRTQLAYYTHEGEFLGQGWYVGIGDLPAALQKEALKGKRLEDLQQVYLFLSPDGLPSYYVTFIKNGKKTLREVKADGETTTVLKKRNTII
jgi:hypothetical protein